MRMWIEQWIRFVAWEVFTLCTIRIRLCWRRALGLVSFPHSFRPDHHVVPCWLVDDTRTWVRLEHSNERKLFHLIAADFPRHQFPWAHLLVVGMLRFMSDINQPSLPTPFFFLFRSCVYFCLYSPFNCISFHKFSRQLSVFSLCSCGLSLAFWSFQLYISLWKSPSALI